jgi:hypothetical protein
MGKMTRPAHFVRRTEMACLSCEGKGWVEEYRGESARFTPILKQCPQRCNITGYSDEVQRRLAPGNVTESEILIPRPVFRTAKVYEFKREDK